MKKTLPALFAVLIFVAVSGCGVNRIDDGLALSPALPIVRYSGAHPEAGAVRIDVTRDTVFLNGSAVITIEGAGNIPDEDAGAIIPELEEGLKTLKAAANPGDKAVVYMDKDVDYGVLFKILQTCYKNGFETVSLAVTSTETGKTAVIDINDSGLRREPGDYDIGFITIIDDSVITIGAKNGFLPSIFYKEYRRYVSWDGGLDTLVEHKPGEGAPIDPRTGEEFTIRECKNIALYAVDENKDVIMALYTKSGELITDADGAPIRVTNSDEPLFIGDPPRLKTLGRAQIGRGDTVFALSYPRRLIIVSDNSDFESRPLLVYDVVFSRFMQAYERYVNAEDIDDFTIAAENKVIYDKVIKVIDAALLAEFKNIYVAKIRDGGGKGIGRENDNDDRGGNLRAAQKNVDRFNKGGFAKEIDAVLSGASDTLHRAFGPPGGRSRTSIQDVAIAKMSSMRKAYNARLRERPGLSGKVTVKFAIDEFGAVIFAQTIESTMDDPEFEDSVVKMVRTWEFERIDKQGDVTEVVYPFVFSQ